MKTHNGNTLINSLILPKLEPFNDVIAEFIIKLIMSRINIPFAPSSSNNYQFISLYSLYDS